MMCTISADIQGAQPEQTSWMEVSELDTADDIMTLAKRLLNFTTDDGTSIVCIPDSVDDEQVGVDAVISVSVIAELVQMSTEDALSYLRTAKVSKS